MGVTTASCVALYATGLLGHKAGRLFFDGPWTRFLQRRSSVLFTISLLMCCRTRAGGCPRLSWPVPAVPAAVSRTLATALLPLLLTLTVHLIPAQVFAADTAQPAALQAEPASVPHQKNAPTPAVTGLSVTNAGL